jgi:hypothetical protein
MNGKGREKDEGIATAGCVRDGCYSKVCRQPAARRVSAADAGHRTQFGVGLI